MKTLNEIVIKENDYPYHTCKHTIKPQRYQIFANQSSSKHDGLHLFLCRYNRVAQACFEFNEKVVDILNLIIKKHSSTITDYHYTLSRKSNGDIDFDTIFLFLNNEVLIELNIQSDFWCCYFSAGEEYKITEVKEAVKHLKSKTEEEGTYIHLLVDTFGMGLRSIKLILRDCSIENLFNNDIIPFHKRVVNKLNDPKGYGILFLHGKSGTGKTSYLLHLISLLKKRVVLVPHAMVNNLLDPKMLSFLAQNKNVVLVIEDADCYCINRENNYNSAIYNLLNLTEGLLSDGLQIQIIGVLNGDLQRIDGALLRKGRLIGVYEFKELEASKATNLSKTVGHNITYNEPTSLANVFHP